ncbi:S1 RNA-binding domain-containing protein [Rosistilla oblonga]|uniref:S1 RNA-binding domain-containing protein n=1 Tax=Rosistilla oblonga TaxID=2527990 RepID=UPI003A97C70E
MTVEIEAIARETGCDAASLKIALPLIRQGYLPPFLARYRRDELNGVSESALWLLHGAVSREQSIDQRRTELLQLAERSTCVDTALDKAIRLANSGRHFDRLTRLIRNRNSVLDDACRLAIRVLNPKEDDTADLQAIATEVLGAEDNKAASAVERLDDALLRELPNNQELIGIATNWLMRNAKIKIGKVFDPHGESDEPNKEAADAKPSQPSGSGAGEAKANETKEPVEAAATEAEKPAAEAAASETAAAETEPTSEAAAAETNAEPAAATEASEPVASEPVASEPAAAAEASETPADATAPAAEATEAAETPAAAPAEASTSETSGETTPLETWSQDAPAKKKKGGKGDGSTKVKQQEAAKRAKKKVSPRQRRRRWLVGVLEPLANKKFAPNKLSAFQILMLARGLRSSVVEASFDYNRGELMQQLQKSAARLNPHISDRLSAAATTAEAALCAAAEEAFWDRQLDYAAERLVDVIADSFRELVLREPTTARGLIAIDAVGPRTAALAVLDGNGKLLHTEDVPCQLSKTMREQMVTKLGELCHQFHVDKIVISNGPARRNCLIALTELLKQTQAGSLHWTLADRSGADLFASADASDPVIRQTPRRFRAAAWIGMQLLDPISAYTKIDYPRLRLASYQRELDETALAKSLLHVMTSGIAAKGADLNGDDIGWLTQLPGVTRDFAKEIDRRRREELFTSRDQLAELGELDEADRRQMIPFLRVFGGTQALDATLIHPDDYALAEKLCKTIDIPMPDAAPPGYQPPNYEVVEAAEPATDGAAPVVVIGEGESDTEPAGFAIPDAETENAADEQPAGDSTETSVTDAQPAAETEAAGEQPAATEEPAAESEAVATEEPAAETTEAPAEAPAAEGESSEAAPAEESPEAAAESAPQAEPAPAPLPMPKHPLPERSAVDKVIKEWQVGRHRVNQIVHWLCEPFSVPKVELAPVALMPLIPKLDNLKPGDLVSGVVVGVAKFGVFVELGPDCSGLIHVSRMSKGFVEDPHEVVQVGDVVNAYVTAIESGRRRVALSVMSPAEEQAASEARSRRDNDRGGREHGNRGQQRGGGNRNAAGGNRGGQAGGNGPNQGNRSGGRGDRANQSGRGGPRRDGGGRGGRDGGRGRDDRGRGRTPQPRTFTVTSSKEPEKQISDSMKTGEEPLRSFGALMQFYQEKTEPVKPAAAASKESKKSDNEAAPATPVAAEAPAPASDKAPETEAAAPQTVELPKETDNAKPAADENASANADANKGN